MEHIKKLGRKKKEILEQTDLDALESFQKTMKRNVKTIGLDNLTKAEKKFVKEFLILKSDDEWTKTIKALKFKHYVLHKSLTQDECTYFVDVDNKGTKPSRERRLTKMSICKLEAAILPKLRAALGEKMNVFSMKDIMCEDSTKFRSAARCCDPKDE